MLPGTPTAPDADGFVRIPVRRKSWLVSLFALLGGLLILVNGAVLLLFTVAGIKELAGGKVTSGVYMLVFTLIFAVPAGFFGLLGLSLVRAARARPVLRIGPTGLAHGEGQILAWSRVRTVSLSGSGRRRAFVVRATPVTNGERLVSRGGDFQWCRITLHRMTTDEDQLRSLLRTMAPERSEFSVVD